MKKALKIITNCLLILVTFLLLDSWLDNSILTYKNKRLQESNEWKQERLRVYVNITSMQDEIIMKNKGSRLQKSEDQELLKETQKLY